MPFYSLNKIRILAVNRQAYLRGVSGYNAGWVQRYTAAPHGYYSEQVTAVVQEAGDRYQIEVGFDTTDAVEHFACDCHAFHAQQGACKHIVAVLVYKYYRDMIEGLPTASRLTPHAQPEQSDAEARRLVDRYMSRVGTQLAAEVGASVALTPLLDLRGAHPAVSFRIGNERTYVIKNLSRFAERMGRGERAVYGKHLTVLHHPESFARTSRPLLSFLMGEMAERKNLPVTPHTGAADALWLSPAGFERLFGLLCGGTVVLRDATGERTVRLMDGNPCVSVTLTRRGSGISIACQEAVPIKGIEHLYVLYGDAVYRTDTAYSRDMTDWLTAAHHTSQRIYVPAEQWSDFYAGVWHTVRPYLSVTGEEEPLQAHAPLPLCAEIRLDAPDPHTITAQVLYRYGDKTLAPYGEQAVAGEWRRDRLAELRVKATVETFFSPADAQDGTLVLQGDDACLFAFVTRGVEALRRVAMVYATQALEHLFPMHPPRVSVGVRLVNDLLEMDVDLAELDPTELEGIFAGYRAGRDYHRLRSGRFVSLDDETLSGLAELADEWGLTALELQSGQVALPKYRALQLEQLLQRRPSLVGLRDTAFRDLAERWRCAAAKEWPIPDGLQSVLRDYQKVGYRWLSSMEELGFGGILADDMGLGKTIQIIARLAAAKEQGTATAPSLVVCPTSVVLNWEREIRRFAPQLTVLCVIGDVANRRRLLQQMPAQDVVITSYDMLKRDVELYTGVCFHYHVLDEAQYIKNSTTQNARAVKAIRSVQRYALTGTPVENRLSELWSIMDFLMPGLLFSYATFRARYELPIMRQDDHGALERLGRLLSPFVLRRLKQEVLAELPPKTERVLFSTMERAQRQVYLASIAQLRQELQTAEDAGLSGRGRMSVLALLTRLRQICCDPRLCCDGYTGGSCKLDACMELLREATAGGHKVLLFSQFTSMLDLVRERLQAEKIPYYILQGSTKKEERASLVDAFNTDSTPVFLISLKAGGTGLNLVGADMVIHYDPWWNLAAQNQATDRAHRIGQTKPLQVVRLVARDTIEDKILQLQESKWQLAQAVVSDVGPALTDLSVEELLSLLE